MLPSMVYLFGMKRDAASSYISFRASPREKAAIEMRADQEGVTVSRWLRDRVSEELGPTDSPGSGPQQTRSMRQSPPK